MNELYIVGHLNPDTDSIASAVGYAWLLREKDGENAIAARAGAINPQTNWVLKQLGIEPPLLLTDASPRFNTVARRYDIATPDNPLRDAWAILNRTGGVAPIVDPNNGSPFGLITGVSLFNFLAQQLGVHPRRQEMRIADILDLPCDEACDRNVPQFKGSVRIRDVINRVLREEHNDFLILDEQGIYAGVARQRDVVNPPRLRIILVDHNEPGQALGAIEEAELVEIVDHHRLGNLSTNTPIRFYVDIVGSTSTLITERIEEAGLSAPSEIAGLLLAGILSDTLRLSSPTTTDRDHRAAERLARWAFVAGSVLAGETIESYGEKVLRSGAGLSTRDPREIVNSDLKIYGTGGYDFAIAQAEVTDLLQLDEHLKELELSLNEMCEKKGLDFAMLMVTDVVGNSSRLVVVNAPPILDDLPYPRQIDGTRLAAGVVSRKKQLLPVIFGLLEV
jgi:manganese-dependent inorganic pyrophosphatase